MVGHIWDDMLLYQERYAILWQPREISLMWEESSDSQSHWPGYFYDGRPEKCG
jgi:hypothetical protein